MQFPRLCPGANWCKFPHAPLHFHAPYGDYENTVVIETGVVAGRFPRGALAAVLEWFREHQDELRENWERRW